MGMHRKRAPRDNEFPVKLSDALSPEQAALPAAFLSGSDLSKFASISRFGREIVNGKDVEEEMMMRMKKKVLTLFVQKFVEIIYFVLARRIRVERVRREFDRYYYFTDNTGRHYPRFHYISYVMD